MSNDKITPQYLYDETDVMSGDPIKPAGNDHNADECKRFAGEREGIARAIWNIRREDEDRCDMELEDMPRNHSVWREADAVMQARAAQPAPPINYGALDPQQRLDVARGVQPAPVVPEVVAQAIQWADHLLFECCALLQTRAPSIHVYNKTFEAVEAAKAMLAAAPAQGQQVECQSCERLRYALKDASVYRQAAEDELAALKAPQAEPTLSELLNAPIPAPSKTRQAFVEEIGAVIESRSGSTPHLIAGYIYDAGARKMDAQQAEQKPAAEVIHVHANGSTAQLMEHGMGQVKVGDQLYTAPQPAPAQDVAGLVARFKPLADFVLRQARFHNQWEQNEALANELIALAAHDNQSGGEA